MAQQGLAIALASNVLQGQLQILEAVVSPTPACAKLKGGGSWDSVSQGQASQASAKLTVRIYYDDACKSLYMSSQAAAGASTSVATIKAVTLYRGVDGHDLGTLTTSASATDAGGGTADLLGTGTFVFAAKGVPVAHLGLACAVPSTLGNGAVKPFPCSGAIAQYFPALGESLGSISPLVFPLAAVSSAPARFLLWEPAALWPQAPKICLWGLGRATAWC